MSSSTTTMQSADVKDNGASSDEEPYTPDIDYYRVGMTVDEMVENYSKWADSYDSDVKPGVYNGPKIISNFVADSYPLEVRKSIKIIDIAAGTGKIGAELLKRGFYLIDALDPTKNMLDIARQQNIYRNYYEEYLGNQGDSSIENDTYDALVVSGAMGEGHLPVSSLYEMVRIVKPGGLIFIIIREKYLTTVEEYKGRLEPLMEELANHNQWRRRIRLTIPNYSNGRTGILFIHEVL